MMKLVYCIEAIDQGIPYWFFNICIKCIEVTENCVNNEGLLLLLYFLDLFRLWFISQC